MSNRFAFVRWKNSPIANVTVENVLRQVLPDWEVDVIELWPTVKDQTGPFLLNSAVTIQKYGWEIIKGTKTFRPAFIRTPFIYDHLTELIHNKLSQNNYAFIFQMQSLFNSSKLGIPTFVYTDHTHLANTSYSEYDQRKLFGEDWIKRENQIYIDASRVFVRSEHVRQSVINDYNCPADKVKLVYAGNNAPVIRGRPRNASYTNKNILFVGVDWERKGGPTLIKAFKMVLETHPDARLTVVGCEPELSDVPNVDIIGRQPPQKVAKHFNQASIFCMPTEVEPFGIVFVEAMAHRLPLIGTRVGAVPDMISEGENGYVINPKDADTLSNYLCKLLDSPELCQNMGTRSHEIYRDKYNWDSVGAKLRDNILETIAEVSR